MLLFLKGLFDLLILFNNLFDSFWKNYKKLPIVYKWLIGIFLFILFCLCRLSDIKINDDLNELSQYKEVLAYVPPKIKEKANNDYRYHLRQLQKDEVSIKQVSEPASITSGQVGVR